MMPVLVLAIAACISLAISGCRERHEPQLRPLDWAPSAPIPTVLSAGDSIEIKFYATPELNELQTIRPDGRIQMQLIGEVRAEGRTPDELARTLGGLYRGQLREPTPVVLVRTFSTRRVFVVGEVLLPGAVVVPGPQMTALEAISAAGGPNPLTAETRNVVIIRRTTDGRYRGFGVNLRDALDGRATGAGLVQPLDIVYVPRTRIAKIDQWVSQHINQIIPRLGLIYTQTMGNSTLGVNLTNNGL